MASSSSKFDLSLYSSGKRGSHTMERSSSFRDNMDNPTLSYLPRNVTQGVDVTNFLQCLRFDLKSMATEYKCNRFGDFKRLANAALCDSQSLKGKLFYSSPEDLKRLRVGLRESTIKARERVKVFSEVLSVINKCFPSIPSRKRTRPDSFSVSAKMGTQNHGAFDYEQSKVEERGKNGIPNKRTRTSLVDQRPNTPARSSGLLIGSEGWEKTKIKKKRSVIKAESVSSTNSLSPKPSGGCRESRVGIHPRSLVPDAMSRLNGFRQEHTPLLYDKGFNLETERSNVKSLNKGNDFVLGSRKLDGAARGPRSGTGVVPKHGQQRSTVLNGLESTNGKRSLSSSPPVAQWADRRPHKISRRRNLVSSNNDEVKLNSPKHLQSSPLSESEDYKFEEKSGLNLKKMSTLVLGTKKTDGRTGKGSGSTRFVSPTAKQLRTGRIGFDKPESKLGRPPTRKLAGRKPYMRQKQSAITATTDFIGGSDDGHEELLAAVKAVINPSSTPFWRHMDPLFGFVTDPDVTYLKHEGKIQSIVDTINPIDGWDNGNMLVKSGTETECLENISICQRLLAALISEEDNNYGSETDVNVINQRMINDVGFLDNHLMADFDPCHQYVNMSMDEKLLIEIHSLGLYPTPVPDLINAGDEDVNRDISRLVEKHNQQVSRKKNLLKKLLKSTEEARELHDKEFQQLSLDKLTGITYQKYMRCCGGKSGNGKMAKVAALDRVKRTLDRCHEFESTGKSCFSQHLFQEMFISRLSQSHSNDAEIDSNDAESVKIDMDKLSGAELNPFSKNHEIYSSDDVWSSRPKRRELYLDDVAGPIITKGKRSEKISKPKGERKSKQSEFTSVNVKQKQELLLIEEEEEGPFDLSHLQLPGIDDFGSGHTEDLGSWLNIEDDFGGDDFMGLEIPMDDLTDLNMMV